MPFSLTIEIAKPSDTKESLLFSTLVYNSDDTLSDLTKQLQDEIDENLFDLAIHHHSNAKFIQKFEPYSAYDCQTTISELGIQNGDKLVFIHSETATSNEPKFILTKEEYASRRDTFRTWKQNNISPSTSNSSSDATKNENVCKTAEEQAKNAISPLLQVGKRCITKANGNARIGTIRWIGELLGREGIWIGIELDLALGRSDGLIDGVRYFECPQNHACFTKPELVFVREEESEDELL